MLRTLQRALLLGMLAIVAAGLLVLRGGRDAAADSPPRVHPAVEVFAQLHPEEMVPVVVRARGDPAALAARVRASGGIITDRFDIIDGFAARVPPQEAERLGWDLAVEWVSLDAPVLPTHKGEDGEKEDAAKGEREDGIDASELATAYPFAANAVPAWEEEVTGRGVTVAVIDSGIADHRDLRGRIAGRFQFSSLTKSRADQNGHGTFVAGIIAGRSEEYIGIAPEAQLLSLKVSGREGYALVSDAIQALQWAVDHREEYGIRVVNISLISAIADSYRLDPLDAAVEQAWFQGIVVVTAAGNFGAEAWSVDHAPANDPYVITVGALDDRGTPDRGDDVLAPWSSRGVTVDGYAKPEVVAPGVEIVSTLASRGAYLAQEMEDAVVHERYIRLSGTSASAAIVSGTVALMLERDPDLTPDQVKFRLMAAAAPLEGSAAPRVDAYAAAFSTLLGEANQDAVPSDLIDPETGEIMYDSVLWRSVLWRSVLWRSVLWSSVLWRN